MEDYADLIIIRNNTAPGSNYTLSGPWLSNCVGYRHAHKCTLTHAAAKCDLNPKAAINEPKAHSFLVSY